MFSPHGENTTVIHDEHHVPVRVALKDFVVPRTGGDPAPQARFPELKDRYELFGLLGERIRRLGLDRNRLYADGYGDLGERPHAVQHGTAPNPLYRPCILAVAVAVGGAP